MRTSFTLALTALASTTLAQTLSDVLASQPDLSTLASALGLVPDLAKTVSGLKDITILAPTNDAFKGLNANGPEAFAIKNKDRDVISQLLSYHVINGTFGSKDFTKIPTYVNSLLMQGNVTAGQNMGLVLNGDKAAILSGQLQYCSVVQADITKVPGITIHKIDQVLTTPLSLSNTLSRLPQINVSAAVGALTATNLVSTVDTLKDITVFIPNNQAFVNAQPALANASIDDLKKVLTYHVIPNAVAFASDATNMTLKTVNGNEVTLSVGFDGTVYVDKAKVVLPNIVIANGVAHIIQSVLNPDEPDVNRDTLATPASTPSLSNTMVPYTSSVAKPSTTISISALATTAQFAAAGGASATTKSASGSAPNGGAASGTPMPSGNGAGKIGGVMGGLAMGFGVVLLV